METNSKAKECGQRLRRIRMAQNLSQQDLADKLFTTPQNISKYEKEGINSVDTIMKINEILGCNLLKDEMDEEGVIGEIGKEILSVLVEHNGYIDVEHLISQYMHGLDMGRITHEIFKLEKIGMCIREQFEGFVGAKNDGLFITAKGLISLKNNVNTSIMSEQFQAKISSAETYEELVNQQGCETYQEVLDSEELEKLIWKLPLHSSYRASYIKYLKSLYTSKDWKGKDWDVWADYSNYLSCIPSENIYFDILYSMIAKVDCTVVDRILREYEPFDYMTPDNSEMADSIRGELILKYGDKFKKRRELGKLKAETVVAFAGLSKWYEEYSKDSGVTKINYSALTDEEYQLLDKSKFTSEDLSLADSYETLFDMASEDVLYTEGSLDWFLSEMAKEKESLLVTEWFSKEEIEAYINANMPSAETEEEKEIDQMLLIINAKYPETLDYYVFPEEWEENGLADLIRSKYMLIQVNK